ncbi:hypothetical protein K0U91_13805 [Chryseobacterium chendengshani]|uniref:hypothetical protein n=1 Tax=Chryseobacterium sp. LJ668 TaxID=2864040 RepID=UPI001C693F36|nr:hypothetical protein [Chryseobacterium sp. LJ668]MBW8522580.1 hypothetical protein [Chryseobacterium sp. LJ668]QYK16117.1 hypothetical protein K0U91_13805 [Chryseobacterium sp. LJ668]
MDDKIKKRLRSEYEELEIQPSADLWNQIDATMEKQPQAILRPASPFQWWKYAAVAVLILSLATLIYYNRDFDAQETDHIVKNNIKKAVLESENNPKIIPQKEDPIKKEEHIIVIKSDQETRENNFKSLQPKKEINQPQFSEPEEKIVIHHTESNLHIQENIEDNSQPLIRDAKKISYITANDLLIGRELDKSREKSTINTKKFGVIHMDNVIPKVGNVTVLGVTVYIDPK